MYEFLLYFSVLCFSYMIHNVFLYGLVQSGYDNSEIVLVYHNRLHILTFAMIQTMHSEQNRSRIEQSMQIFQP